MQQRKTDKQRLREDRRIHRADRWEGFKLLVLLPLCAVTFTAIGLLMVAAAISVREGGPFGFALMALGLGVGMLGLSIVNYLEYFEARAARRSTPFDVHESGQKIVDDAQQNVSQEGSAAGGRRRRRAAARSSKTSFRYSLMIVPALFAAACWAIGAGFILFGHGPGQPVGSAGKSIRVWVVAMLVWGGLAALGITVVVNYIRDCRQK